MKTVKVPCAECERDFPLSARDYFAETDYMKRLERERKPVRMRRWFCSKECFRALRDREAGSPARRKGNR